MQHADGACSFLRVDVKIDVTSFPETEAGIQTSISGSDLDIKFSVSIHKASVVFPSLQCCDSVLVREECNFDWLNARIYLTIG